MAVELLGILEVIGEVMKWRKVKVQTLLRHESFREGKLIVRGREKKGKSEGTLLEGACRGKLAI
jgi:hypothetical protein